MGSAVLAIGKQRNYIVLYCSAPAVVSEQDLVDTYYPAFVSCANRGNASGLMCSYNSVNGVPSCANKNLLTNLAREKWGFNGISSNTKHVSVNSALVLTSMYQQGLDGVS